MNVLQTLVKMAEHAKIRKTASNAIVLKDSQVQNVKQVSLLLFLSKIWMLYIILYFSLCNSGWI